MLDAASIKDSLRTAATVFANRVLSMSRRVASQVYTSRLLVEVLYAVIVYSSELPATAVDLVGGRLKMLAELTYVGPDAAVFADTVTTDVAGYGD